MSIPTREEFKLLIGAAYSAIVNYESDPSRSCGADIDVAERGLTAAYDAALARIAELERHIEGLHCNAIEAMLPTIPKVPEMIGLESSSLFPEEK